MAVGHGEVELPPPCACEGGAAAPASSGHDGRGVPANGVEKPTFLIASLAHAAGRLLRCATGRVRRRVATSPVPSSVIPAAVPIPMTQSIDSPER